MTRLTSLHALAAGAAGAAIALAACSGHSDSEQPDLARWVDPLIGSGAHGHVFVGASVPYGMVQLGPTAITQAWDWTSGYHDSDSTIIGFSHTHLSGTGVGDLFDITVMPVVGEVTYARGRADDPQSGLWSYGPRASQQVSPGYYAVDLERYGIRAELTSTNRVGMHRYTFPATDSAAIVIDLRNGGCFDRPTSTAITPVSSTRITGHRHSTGWAADQRVYFAAELSEPFDQFTQHGEGNMYGRLSFAPGPERQILMKVALSPTSVEAAERALEAELPGWDFDSVATAARSQWNTELARIRVDSPGADTADLRKYYTALYHAMVLPATFNDIDSTPAYTILSLWDTYRTHLPLLSIIDRERSAEIANTMLAIHESQGRLPVWHLWGNETDCMVGNPGVIAVADAVAKHTPGVDPQRAMRAMLATTADTARGGGLRRQYGYIPCDLFTEAVAYDMEYAIADAAVANAARAIGDSVTAARYDSLSHSWRVYFDPATRFVRGRDSKGGWRTPFDPRFTTHRVDDYCEGNAWQYTWLVPHDLDGLVSAFGSREATVAKLDSLFIQPSELTGNASPDITGLIGQYAHGNEPSHHTIYLYSMLGEPDKAARLLRRVYDTLYTDAHDGLCGNEDAGQMSAWLVLSGLGFYQVEPASGRYWIGTPLFERAEIRVPGGTFTVEAPGVSPERYRVASATLNGKPLTRPWITHEEILAGGTLHFDMH